MTEEETKNILDSSGSSSDWYPELAPSDVPEEARDRDSGMTSPWKRIKNYKIYVIRMRETESTIDYLGSRE